MKTIHPKWHDSMKAQAALMMTQGNAVKTFTFKNVLPVRVRKEFRCAFPYMGFGVFSEVCSANDQLEAFGLN